MTDFTGLLDGLSKSAGFLDNVSALDSIIDVASNVGIAGFVFHIANDTSAEFQNDITDHYIEDGSVVQDMIAFKPITLTLSGYVGEYINIVADEKSGVQKVAEKLTVVSNYAKTLSAFAKQTSNAVKQLSNGDYADALVNEGKSLFDLYQDTAVAKNEQNKAFAFFVALRERGTLVKVKTPWANYNNMAIESLSCKQNSDTNDITDFEIKLKQVRMVKTINAGKVPTLQGRLNDMIKEAKNKGADLCKKVGLSSLFGG